MKIELTSSGIQLTEEGYADQLYIAWYCEQLSKKERKYWQVRFDRELSGSTCAGDLTAETIRGLKENKTDYIKTLTHCLFVD
jgi:hypothetical protein